MADLKPAKTYDEQIDILTNKHRLIVCDREFAKDTLSKVSYYRLSAYGLSLRNPDNNNLYREGTTFEQIYALYRFDSHLRNILLPMVEHMEIELRTKFAYHLAMAMGPAGYRNIHNFNDHIKYNGNSVHNETTQRFKQEVVRNTNHPIVKHHNTKYGGHFPNWVAIEMFSFGMLSSLQNHEKRGSNCHCKSISSTS